MTWILLLAFSLQSFITETHLHPFAAAGSELALQAPIQGHAPFDQGQANCPFCQAVVHAGAFFAPASPNVYRPNWTAGIAVFSAVRGVRILAGAHSWNSRAPPQLRV